MTYEVVGPFRRLTERHGKHADQAGEEGRRGGSTPGFTHEEGSVEGGGSGASRAVSRLKESGLENPLNKLQTVYQVGDSIVKVAISSVNKDSEIRLHSIEVPESDRGTGAASAVLDFIIDTAREEGAIVTGTISPIADSVTGEVGLSFDELKDWYTSHGFEIVREGDDSADIEFRPSMTERHGQHIGQEGIAGQAGGSGPGFTHVPGSIPGSGRRVLSGSAARGPEKADSIVREAQDSFADTISSLRGTDVSYYGEAEGGYRGESGLVREISMAMDIKTRDKKAVDEFKKFLSDNDQESGLVWGTDVDGDATVGTIWTFPTPPSQSDRDDLAGAMDEIGFGGWTWRLIGGRESLVILSVPEWGGSPEEHNGQATALGEHMTGIDLETNKKSFRTNVNVLESGRDY